MSEKRLKIFVSAYACEPEKGSEPGIGWNVVNELAKYHEVHVLTRANNQPPIDASLAGKTADLPVFHYYDLPHWLTFWKKKRRGYHLYYYLWQYGAFFKYCKFVNASGFDVVQHLTFANIAMPSLFMLCKPLTIWGPIGEIFIPAGVRKALPLKIRLKETVRRLVMHGMYWLEPMRFLTPRCANYIMEYQENPRSCFTARWQKKIIRHSQTGINPQEPAYQIDVNRGRDGRIHLLICSEFLHWKGCCFAAEAAAVLLKKYPDTVLDIFGSGPEKAAMKALLADPAIAGQIFWHGFVSKQEMLQALADSDILLYPSYHHGLATVILQSMYFKLPIVALAGDPVAETVRQGCGSVASGNGRSEITASIIECTEKLILSPDLRRQMGERGRELIQSHYDWKILCREMSHIYSELVQKKGVSPCQ